MILLTFWRWSDKMLLVSIVITRQSQEKYRDLLLHAYFLFIHTVVLIIFLAFLQILFPSAFILSQFVEAWNAKFSQNIKRRAKLMMCVQILALLTLQIIMLLGKFKITLNPKVVKIQQGLFGSTYQGGIGKS